MNPTVWIVWRVDLWNAASPQAALTHTNRTIFGVYANESTARNQAQQLGAALPKQVFYEVEEVEVQG